MNPTQTLLTPKPQLSSSLVWVSGKKCRCLSILPLDHALLVPVAWYIVFRQLLPCEPPPTLPQPICLILFHCPMDISMATVCRFKYLYLSQIHVESECPI